MRQKDLFDLPIIANQEVASIPYMGSKRKLATKILNTIYQTIGDFERFYDLFGGGGALSVASLEAGHIVHYNELNKGVANLLQYIQDGGKLPTKWVSREEFMEHKDGDDWYSGFIKCIWSFGNNQRDYLFGKEIEDIKKEAHNYVLTNGYNGDTLIRQRLLKNFTKKQKIEGRFNLQRLENLQRLQSLENLETNSLTITSLSYNQVKIQPNSVIYCDPPYRNTAKYQKTIDYDKFYQWCLENPNPVFISEYEMPKEFTKIASFQHRSTLSATENNKITTEKLYWNNKIL